MPWLWLAMSDTQNKGYTACAARHHNHIFDVKARGVFTLTHNLPDISVLLTSAQVGTTPRMHRGIQYHLISPPLDVYGCIGAAYQSNNNNNNTTAKKKKKRGKTVGSSR